MRNLIASVAIALALAVGTALAAETPPNQPPPGSPDKATVYQQLKSNGATPKKLSQAACCPYAGVCGCQFQRIVCCNGRYSPYCGC